jgi:5-formyltetrahydrofolate cyclo-ligase
MNKKELRIKYKALRQQLTTEKVDTMSLLIANNILHLNTRLLNCDFWDNTYFHLFITIKEHMEVETEFILHVLAGKDKEIVVSKSNFDTIEMTNFLLTDATKFKKNDHNIFEPTNGLEVPNEKIDVVFIPLLAYDKKGNRVGYGKGFYDDFLSKCKKEVIKIGLSFFDPEEQIDDVSDSDVKLHYCITPTTMYSFL